MSSVPSTMDCDTDFKGFLVDNYNNTITTNSEYLKFISQQHAELDTKIGKKCKIPSESLNEHDHVLSNKLTNPLLKIPLTQYGWKREVVSRTTNCPGVKNRMFDVYYYSPEGKKLRSSTQILDYLPIDSDLHGGHFSFSKGLIGLNSDIEWVREARTNVNSPSLKTNKDKDSCKLIHSKSNESKPTKKISSQNLNKRRISKTSMHEGDSFQQNINKKIMTKPPSYEEDSLDSVWSPTIPGTTREAMQNPLICSILCPAALGCIPMLQCTSCLCLYHPQCLNLDPDNQYYKYVCPNCKKKIQDEEEELSAKIKQAKESSKELKMTLDPKVNIAAKSNVPIDPKVNIAAKSNVPIDPKVNMAVKSNVPTVISKKKYTDKLPQSKVAKLGRPIKPLRPLAPVLTQNNSTNVVPNLGTKRDAPMQILIQYGKKQFIAVPKQPSNSIVRTTLPTSTGNKRLVENQLPVTAKSPVVPKMPGLLFSAPKTKYYVLQNGQMQNILSNTIRDQVESSPSGMKKIIHSKENFLSLGSNGFHILIQIFKYLSLCDLLRAAQVNQLFYAASRHSSLWKTIKLKNIHVKDWEKFARCLNKNDSEIISFNKMITNKGDPEDVKIMWRSINEALGKISSLRHLDLSRCAGPEISIIKQCVHLTHFTCSFYKKSLLDFYGFSSIQNLTHLYIRGVELNKIIGLKVLNIHVLSKLKHLTHLALTSVKQSSHDTNWAMFLADMVQLEWLELGECTHFRNEFVKNALGQLCLLKHLRLEMVTELIANDVLNTIATFPHLNRLELINFDVKHGFEEAFCKCINLRCVLIIPTYIKQSAVTVQRMVIALSSMNHILKRVVWGLTVELLKVTEMLVTQHDFPLDPAIDCTNCVPIMPRIGLELDSTTQAKKAAQVEVIPVDQLRDMLAKELPSVDVMLVKIPYVSTVKQFLPLK